ncbi:MAG: hypothetical protein Q9170_005840 [Blastenia crenularia]
MRPLLPFELQDDLLIQKPILLLKTTVLPINYLIKLVFANKLSGAAAKVPSELWLKIVAHYTTSCGNGFLPVVPISITASPHRQLRCKGVVLKLGDFSDRYAVMAAEEFLASTLSYHPHPFGEDRRSELILGHPDPEDEELRLVEHDYFSADEVGIEYSIVLPKGITSAKTSAPALKMIDCLFTAVAVPDIVAWLENGQCWVCNGERDICPGCTGGVAQKFDAFMGCGTPLACPLCMGLDFMAEDKIFLKKFYWNPPSDDEAAARKARLNARWIELDYQR